VYNAKREWVFHVDQYPGSRWHPGGVELLAPSLCSGVQGGEVE
jgi:hypothetical protein